MDYFSSSLWCSCLHVSTSTFLLCNIQQVLTKDRFGEGLNFVESSSRKPMFLLCQQITKKKKILIGSLFFHMLWNLGFFLFSSTPSLWYEDCPHYLWKVLFVPFYSQGRVHRRDRDEDAWSHCCADYAPNAASPISFSGGVCKARNLEPNQVKKRSDLLCQLEL